LHFQANTFDVAISNQNYNFIENAQKHMNEIYRVLKPGGVCFFGARNKFNILEGQYNLPFLSWLPENLAKIYIEATGRKNYFLADYKTMWELKKMCNKFRIKSYTVSVIKNPDKYNYPKLIKFKPVFTII